MTATHEVLNQPSPLAPHDALARDPALRDALLREGAAWAEEEVSELGRMITSDEARLWAEQANANPPTLKTHDRYGNRVDEVEYHPAYHELMRVSVENGIHAGPWREPRAGAHVARAAKMMLASTNEQGHGCPISMTYSAYPALARQPELLAEWGPRILSLDYDERFIPAAQKRGAIFGMAMTEKQGGSDVRANTTRADPIGQRGPGREYRLTGHKWFCSAPMSDGFLVLAQAPGGLSCFLLPRFLPDGSRNEIRIQRLKDKLGNRSNASSEVEYEGAWARLVGEEGRGVSTILEMVNHTRLDCVIGSTAIMRRALVEAVHHCRQRSAFGKKLIDQPLMRAVLADLTVETEAATALMMRLARAYDRRRSNATAADDSEAAFARLATAAGKFWICKRVMPMVSEALECLGGVGYVEETGLPRLYREAPVNSVWEGSGNVICLDVLRALAREPAAAEAVVAELRLARGGDRRLDEHVDRATAQLASKEPAEPRARKLVEALAVALQGSLLVRFAPRAVADAFCATRIGGDWGHTFGALPASTDVGGVLERAFPEA